MTDLDLNTHRPEREATNGRPDPARLPFEPATQQRAAVRAQERRRLVRRWLTAADVLALALAFAIVEPLAGLYGETGGWRLILLMAATVLLLVLLERRSDRSREDEIAARSTAEDAPLVFHFVTAGACFAFAGATLTGLAQVDLADAVMWWAVALVLMIVSRAVARAWCRRRVSFRQRVVIVGAGQVGQHVARKVLRHPEYGLELVGFVDHEPLPLGEDVAHVPVLGSVDELGAIVAMFAVDRVVVAFSRSSPDRTLAVLREVESQAVHVDVVPRLYELVDLHARVARLEALPLVTVRSTEPGRTGGAAKRMMDIVGASLGLLLTSPLLACIAWRVHRSSNGPVLFRQTRLGLDGKPFTLLKFRTMRVDVDVAAHRDFIEQTMNGKGAAAASKGLYKLDYGDAVTPVGRWLRKTSLDELPQLINVLRGEMSLVGPRPCIPYETAHFEPRHFERFRVRPGITGFWQVTARAQATFAEALDMDVSYVQARSFGLDLRLLLHTPAQVLGRKATS